MAFSTRGYAGLIDSMLELRSQRLKEQIAEAEIAQKNQDRFAAQMQSMGKGLSGMFSQMGENQTYNRLGREFFGGGAAAEGGIRGGSTGSAYSQPGVGGTRSGGWGGGGAAEMKIRLALADQHNQDLAANLGVRQENRLQAGQNFEQNVKYPETVRQYNTTEGRIATGQTQTHDLAERDLGERVLARQESREDRIAREEAAAIERNLDNIRAEEAAKRDKIRLNMEQDKEARNILALPGEDLQKKFTMREKYETGLGAILRDVDDAPDKQSYDRAVRRARNWRESAVDVLGKDRVGELPEFSPYLDPEQRTQLARAQREAAVAQKAALSARSQVPGWTDMMREATGMGGVGIPSVQEAVRRADEAYKAKQGVVEGIQGAAATPEAATAEAPGVAAAAPAVPVNARRHLPGQPWERWNGRAWIPE